jgi:outer membrane protein assembly factor BamE (lipoprotein component of BamABCDE complex)
MTSACMNSGNPNVMDQSRLDQIFLDVSTKEDVRRLLGQPNRTAKQSNSAVTGRDAMPDSETWTYRHLSVDVDGATFIPIVGLFAGGATSKITIFTVVFDQSGIVRHIDSSQSQGRSGSNAQHAPSTSWSRTQ